MSNLSWKMTGLAAAVAVSALLATVGAASALVLPVPGQPTVSEAGQSDSQVLLVESRQRNQYNRNRHGYQAQHRRYDGRYHGRRYGYRRHGYGYHYGNYWYASPWWLLAAPTLAITVPTVTFGGDAHVQSCMNRYRSYNPNTDMFMGYDGRLHRCAGTY